MKKALQAVGIGLGRLTALALVGLAVHDSMTKGYGAIPCMIDLFFAGIVGFMLYAVWTPALQRTTQPPRP
jgi:hypothetical protein